MNICSFCEKDTGIIIKSEKACICDECVLNCMGLIVEKARKKI